jgi:hypothetical protein
MIILNVSSRSLNTQAIATNMLSRTSARYGSFELLDEEMRTKDLVEAPDGGYYEVHITRESTCYIPGLGRCLVTNKPRGYYTEFAYRIEKVIGPKGNNHANRGNDL